MKIIYDPIQHFHKGFHQPMIDFPSKSWSFVKGQLEYFFPHEMNYGASTEKSKNVLMMGKMQGIGDLAFSPHTLLTNDAPWVVDIEHPDWFFMNAYLDVPEEDFIFDWKLNIAKKILESSSCKRILCRSKFAMSSMDSVFKSRIIREKCILFYPMQPLRPPIKRGDGNITLGIVISSYADYFRKGGDIAIKMLSTLRNKHKNLELIYVGSLPPKNFFYNPEKTHGLRHYPNLPHDEIMNNILPSIDILLFPSRADTWGTVALEAMSMGIPVIAHSGKHVYGLGEVVDNGQNGVLIRLPHDERPLHALTRHIDFNSIISSTDILISNSDLRNKIGFNARKLIKSKLSINNMNKILSGVVKT